MNPVYEEIMKKREEQEKERTQKMKKRFANIIQTNQKEKEIEQRKKINSDSSSEDMDNLIINKGIEPPLDDNNEPDPLNMEASNRAKEKDQQQVTIQIDSDAEKENPPNSSIVTEEGEFYQLEKILDKKIINGEVHYLIKWKN